MKSYNNCDHVSLMCWFVNSFYHLTLDKTLAEFAKPHVWTTVHGKRMVRTTTNKFWDPATVRWCGRCPEVPCRCKTKPRVYSMAYNVWTTSNIQDYVCILWDILYGIQGMVWRILYGLKCMDNLIFAGYTRLISRIANPPDIYHLEQLPILTPCPWVDIGSDDGVDLYTRPLA